MLIKIAKLGNSSPIDLAACELKKYLSTMDSSADIAVMSFGGYKSGLEKVLWVGIDPSLAVPQVADPELDDAVSIKVKGGYGYITGTNERSVLIGAYRYLTELGCSFLRPGDDGEIIPAVNLSESDVEVFEAASYRHRSVCIEGSDSYDNIADFIAWLPKVAMNGFYNQFRVPFTFYDRWYSHMGNDFNQDRYQISVDDAEGLMNQSICEIKKRGLMYHAVGHGWTCEPFGIEALGWYDCGSEPAESIKDCVALVNGKREYWEGIPMNTNLCYSSPRVIETISKAVCDYSAGHPEVDYLHVWLADGENNHCECDECKKHRPADYYIKLLNAIDERLTEACLSTRIVFLIYVDLLWEPLEEKLNNPDRFVLMFAPITRTYSSDMVSCPPYQGELADYNRNKNKMPSSVSENITRLNNWQKQFDGDSFDFDYHYMWEHFRDLGNYQIAKVLFDDMKGLDRIGLNGMVSCQCIRAFYPHGLGMNAMAAALWDKSATFDDVADRYFSAAFGQDWALVRDYMKELSRLVDPVYMRGEYGSAAQPRLVCDFDEAQRLTDEFAGVIERNLAYENKTVALSYAYLSFHNKLAALYLDWAKKLAANDADAAKTALAELKNFAFKHEDEAQRVFDAFVFSVAVDQCHNRVLK
ncbi:MAG: DUF4838 domain-containing protein [Clostridia bacterium]|nr:DUF4838 domain-containing protein [Clostridia bacterium]